MGQLALVLVLIQVVLEMAKQDHSPVLHYRSIVSFQDQDR